MTQAASGIDLFIPEVYDIVWSLIILVIVAVFFYKFFMPKFNAIFDERAAKIQGNIAKAEQARKDADEAKAKYEAQLSTARVDAAKIRDDARARAESDAAQITASAQRSIESQHQQAIVSLKGEVGALATALAGKILGAKLEDNDVQSSMIDSMIDDLGAKK